MDRHIQSFVCSYLIFQELVSIVTKQLSSFFVFSRY